MTDQTEETTTTDQSQVVIDGKPGGDPQHGKTFTQEDVDKLVNVRLARERQKFADYDEVKSKAAELDKVREASQSDLERAVTAARKEGAQQATTAANQRLVRAEARALAAGAKFRDPSDAVAFLGDLSKVRVSTDGEVDTDALNQALADLAKSKPYLLQEEKPTRPTGDPGQGPRADAPVNGAEAMNAMIRSASGRG